MRGWISAAEVEEEGGGEVWSGWLGGWWRSLEANHIPNQEEMQREDWIVQRLLIRVGSESESAV